MAPVYWIIGLIVIAALFWLASRANGHRGGHARQGDSARDLAQENYRLRHVLAQLAVENHDLKSVSRHR